MCVSGARWVELNLWPASPSNPQTAIHMHLMDSGRSFLLEAHTSLKAFAAGVKLAASTNELHKEDIYNEQWFCELFV